MCKKEMYNDNFCKHNNTAHHAKAKMIEIVPPSQKRLSFASKTVSLPKFISNAKMIDKQFDRTEKREK